MKFLAAAAALMCWAGAQAQPRAEYPRPQFVRESWRNLNGEWGFSFDELTFDREIERSAFSNLPGHINAGRTQEISRNIF